MGQIYIHERARAKRLIIDIDPDRYPFNPYKVRPGQALWFQTSSAPESVGRIVKSWIQAGLDDHTLPKDHNPYLPDLILKHADEWGLQ